MLGKLKSVREGAATVFDRTCAVYLHEHAEANDHKNSGLALIVAGHAGGLITGRHSRMTGAVGDLYLTLANRVMGADLKAFPGASQPLAGVVA